MHRSVINEFINIILSYAIVSTKFILRESVAVTIDGSVRDFLSEVHIIWDEIGLSTEVKSVRFKQASEHLQVIF